MIFDLANNIDKELFEKRCQKLIDKKVIIEIKEKRLHRTIRQNSYLHVCLAIFSIEFGYSMQETKTLLKRNCSFMIYEKNHKSFLRSTADLDTKEMTDFIEFIREYSAKEGLYIPTSEEYIKNQTSIDKEIEQNKMHL